MAPTAANLCKVIHAPFDVGSNAAHLARAERDLGFDSSTLVYFQQWFGFKSDRNLKLKPGADPMRSPRWWLEMLRVARTADVLHFNFGGSFLNDVGRGRVYPDLPVWRRLGIRTFVSFQGCDSRLSDFSTKEFKVNACENCRSRPYCRSTYDTFRRECLDRVGALFDGVFAVNPDLMHNIPGAKFLPYSNCDIRDWTPPQGYSQSHPGPVRVLHAPTWREIKGSDYIIGAIEALKAEGENVELVLVEKIPHDKVRAIYESADILVDQVLVGWYGGLAVELMALGKPVVAYIRERDLKFVPAAMRDQLPVVSADPSTIKEVIRKLVRDVELRRSLAERSRRFVEDWHDPKKVAEITTKAYRAALDARPLPLPERGKTLWRMAKHTARPLAKLYVQQSPFHGAVRRLSRGAAAAAIYASLPLVRLAGALRLWIGRPSSVWGTVPILTLPLLSRGDRVLGFRSRTSVYSVYYITQSFDSIHQNRINWLCRRAPSLLEAYYRLVLLVSLFRHDVFHYFNDQGFVERDGRFGINPKELKWLRLAGKRLYLYAYGADVRTRNATLALGKYNCCTNCNAVGKHCICDDRVGAEKQALYRKYATGLCSMGDMMTYVPGARDLHYWPFDTATRPFVGATWDGRSPLKILHVPNHEWAKGSDYLRRALAALKARGIEYTLVQVQGKPNTEVLRLMSEADIIADQFLIGWLGYTALEAMALGKVVLCYIRDRSMLPAERECPIVSANPDTLEHVLAEVAAWDRARFETLGSAGRRYIERHYSVDAVAARVGQMYLETASFPLPTRRAIERGISQITLPPAHAPVSALPPPARRDVLVELPLAPTTTPT